MKRPIPSKTSPVATHPQPSPQPKSTAPRIEPAPAGSESPVRSPLDLSDDDLDAFLLDDDYDPAPEPGDFWLEHDDF